MSNSMCSVVMPKTPAKPRIGEVRYGSQFLRRIDVRVSELEGTRLIQGEEVRFYLADIGVDVGALEWKTRYQCPWTGNSYYWMFPLGVLTNNMERYRLDASRPWRHRLIRSHGANTPDDVDPSMVTGSGAYGRWEDGWDRIVDATMGHGFTDRTFPATGQSRKAMATIPLDNGDEILVSCWIWCKTS